MKTIFSAERTEEEAAKLRMNYWRAAAAAMAMAMSLLPTTLHAQATVVAPHAIPDAPTTADTIYFSLPGRCAAAYRSPAYTVTMTGTRIKIAQRYVYPPPPCPIPPLPDTQFPLITELGRLPAGTYSIDATEVIETGGNVVESTTYAGLPLVVAPRVANTTPPQPLLNYSGHWWDPTDSGSGFMIYQSSSNAVMVAWFTYGFDGKAAWYTLQGGSWVSPMQYVGPLLQVSRPPDPNAPGGSGGPISVNIINTVGTATLDFTGVDGINTGVFTATLAAGGQVSRNIRRFGK